MKTINRYMELRNLVLIEPETQEFVQLSYLCDIDSQLTESELLDNYGGIRNVGIASDKSFFKIGLYLVSLYYERNGATMREKENPMDGFVLVSGNIYKPNQLGMETLYKMKRNNKKKNRQAA